MKTHTVSIQKSQFTPQTLTIKLHDQVRWENKDSINHQVKGKNWGNVPLRPGRRFTQAFDEIGSFPYSCALHPEMKGTIIVEK